MKTMQFVQHADTDSFVRVAVPVDDASQSYRVTVTVTVEPEKAMETENTETQGKLRDEWPPGFFERTYGAWKGELERAPQGEYEERTPF